MSHETSGHAAKFGDELLPREWKKQLYYEAYELSASYADICDNQFSCPDMPVRIGACNRLSWWENRPTLRNFNSCQKLDHSRTTWNCRVSQIKDEVKTIVGIIKEFYSTMGMMDGYWVSLSVCSILIPERSRNWWCMESNSLNDHLKKLHKKTSSIINAWKEKQHSMDQN